VELGIKSRRPRNEKSHVGVKTGSLDLIVRQTELERKETGKSIGKEKAGAMAGDAKRLHGHQIRS